MERTPIESTTQQNNVIPTSYQDPKIDRPAPTVEEKNRITEAQVPNVEKQTIQTINDSQEPVAQKSQSTITPISDANDVKKIEDKLATQYFKQKYQTLTGKAPIIFAHRGASGYRPAHTIPGYELAIEMGADFIEPDLVLTKDLVPVCRHEPMLSCSTNVADFPEFADKKCTKIIDGESYTDWFVSDFTFDEIKKLRAVQIYPERPQIYNGLYPIPTFDQVIELAKTKSAELNRTIGIYPETKHPTFHEQLGMPITQILLEALTKADWNHQDAPVYVQSFEVSNLQYISQVSTVKNIQLINAAGLDKDGNFIKEGCNAQPYDFVVAGDPRTYGDLLTDEGMDFVKTYAVGISVWTAYIRPFCFQDSNGDGIPDDINNDGIIDFRDYHGLKPTDLVVRAHKKGLEVHCWTLKNEPGTLLSDYKDDPVQQYKDLYGQGVDGVFSEFIDTAMKSRE